MRTRGMTEDVGFGPYTVLAADVEADKPFSVSFDPASLLAF
jgi:hypothetical protein